MTMWFNPALEPTATVPAVRSLSQMHACGFSRRGSVLDREALYVFGGTN